MNLKDNLANKMTDVMILAGSKSDSAIVEKAEGVLKDAKTDYVIEYCSAHREPERLDDIIKATDAKVFICIAGLSAALPGVVASKTKNP